MKIISVVGKTNSGKTTLIEKIIPELKKRGYKVGAVKHTDHQFEVDHESKDTWRMTQAGADTVVIASNEKMAMIKNVVRGFSLASKKANLKVRTTKEMSIDELVQWLFPDVDIVITEGYKKENKPKIEVTRNGELLCNKNDNLIAVVDNRPSTADNKPLITDSNVPCFDINNIKKIVDFIDGKIINKENLVLKK